MPAVQTYCKAITADTHIVGSGGTPVVQTISNVRDKAGNLFTGRLAVVWNANAILNAITNTGNAYGVNWGIDNGVIGCAGGDADIYQFGSLKVCSAGATTRFSVLDTGANAFFGGDIFRAAYVSAFRLGEFDITYDLNTRTGDTFLVTILGGDTLNIDIASGTVNVAHATVAEPVAMMAMRTILGASATKGGSNGAGGGPMTWGWDTKMGTRGSVVHFVGNQSSNARGQRNDTFAANCDLASYQSGFPIVSVWGSNSYTISGSTGSIGVSQVAFSGLDVRANSGVFTQLLSPGRYSFDTQINPKWVMFAGDGVAPASNTLQTDLAEIALGWTDGTRQGGSWHGENVVGNSVPLRGARFFSDASLLRFASAINGASTTFGAIAEIIEVRSDGIVTINWSTVDGLAREIRWFALGERPTIIPPITVINPICLVPQPSPVFER